MYGTVKCGFHKIHGAVAVKCSLSPGKQKKKDSLEKKIKEEIGLLQSSSHDNIVRVYGWTQWPGAIAIIMEYLPGGNLIELLLDCDVVLEPALLLRMGYEIANGIAFIHNLTSDHRIIHGDIKPENILLTEELHCKIGDFGSARLCAYTGASSLTTTDHKKKVHLTELYAAPEVVNDPSIKPKPSQDIYSFGFTLYMMLGREIPVSAEHMLLYLENVKNGERPTREKISNFIHQLKEEKRSTDAAIITTLKDVMENCWQQDPTCRFPMITVKDTLHKILAKHSPVEIQQHVLQATTLMDLMTPCPQKYDCAQLDQFLPPDFKNIADHSSFKNNISPCGAALTLPSSFFNAEPINSSSSAIDNELSEDLSSFLNISAPNSTHHSSNSDLDEEFLDSTSVKELAFNKSDPQLIIAKFKSIKNSLREKDNVLPAITQCVCLINDSMRFLTNDYDVVVDDVISIASVLRKHSNYNKAIEILRLVVDVNDKITNPLLKLEKLFKLAEVIHLISYEMTIYIEMGGARTEQTCLPLLDTLREKVRLVRISNSKVKVETETGIMLYMGMCYFYCGKYKKADEMSKSTSKFVWFFVGEDSRKWAVFASCYFVSAVVNHKMNNFKTAVELYTKSNQFRKTVEDQSADEKAVAIENADKLRNDAKVLKPYNGLFRFKSRFNVN